MKNILFCAMALLIISVQLTAQTAGALWAGSRSGFPAANAVHQVLAPACDALAAGRVSQWLNYCSNEVALSDPDADLVLTGARAIRDRFPDNAANDAPRYRYDNVLVRVMPNDYALAIWGIARISDNARSQGSATLRKINGQWKIEFCVCDLAEM